MMRKIKIRQKKSKVKNDQQAASGGQPTSSPDIRVSSNIDDDSADNSSSPVTSFDVATTAATSAITTTVTTSVPSMKLTKSPKVTASKSQLIASNVTIDPCNEADSGEGSNIGNSELTVPTGGRKIRSSSYCIGDYEGLLSMVNPSLQQSAIASLGTSASIAASGNFKNCKKGTNQKLSNQQRRSLSIRDGMSITSSIVIHPPENVEVIDPTRETWNKKVDFLLSVIGFAVDLANVWRFPYLCYKNGGGAFLIPFAIMLAVGGVPLFYMELALGQYHRKGAITCWGRIVPAFKGIGYAVVLIAFYVDFYYNVIIAWSLYYFIHSFSSSLPWTSCNNEWNSKQCKVSMAMASINSSDSLSAQSNLGASVFHSTNNNLTSGLKNVTSAIGKTASPAEEYFNRGLLELHQSTGIEGLGTIKWDMALCLAAVYIICYFSLWKGISTSGKVVWFTALFPYVVLTILLIRGITLPGAMEGIKYYLTPNFSALNDANVWVDAATQVFFSLGPGFGVLLAFASYNRFNNNVYRDALLTSAINSATSFLAGFVIFSVLGYMAHQNNVEVKDVAAEGPGLVFIVYPEAISTFPGAPFFSLMFFLMLLTLGLDSSFGGSEAIITGLSDEFPIIKKNREIFVALLFTLYFMVGLASCAQGGVYVVELLDRYAASYSILFAVFCETIAISWIYGLKRFSADIKAMLGFDPGWWWKFCWFLCAPIFLMVIIIYGLYSYEPLTYGSYVYPTWANVLGMIIAGSSVACIPIGAVIQFIRAPGQTFKNKLVHILTPIPPVFIPTTDVNELLAAAAASGGIASNTGISFEPVTEAKKSHGKCAHAASGETSDNSCNSESPTTGGRCGRIGVNCLHNTLGGSNGNLDSECSNCNSNTNSEQSLKCNSNPEGAKGHKQQVSKLHKITLGHFTGDSGALATDLSKAQQQPQGQTQQQQQRQQPAQSTTIMVNPSISLDSTQV